VSATVVVFGATSYIGSHLVRLLLQREFRVVGVSRGPLSSSILLGDLDPERFVAVRPEQVSEAVEGHPAAVVNFAFVKDFDMAQRIHHQNRVLLEAAGAAAGPGGRLIQISTAAVFGYVFDEEPRPVRVRRPPADLYGETKLQAEHLGERISSRLGFELAIVRLGNVIGPGSPLFVADLAQQMLEARPLGYENEDGPSNCTHVENIADYVAELIGAPSAALEAFGHYHHLAEFSDHPWSEILDAISAEIGLPWIRTSRPEAAASAGPALKRILKRLYLTDTGGRMTRAALGVLPESAERIAAGMRTPLPPGLLRPAGAEPSRGPIDVLSNPHRFRSHVFGEWRAPLELEPALAGIRSWLAETGYVFEPVG
jgi:nucleoside-diphosphate-sugar epimerase